MRYRENKLLTYVKELPAYKKDRPIASPSSRACSLSSASRPSPNSTLPTSPSSPSSSRSRPGRDRLNFLTGFAAGIVSYTGLIYWVVVAMNTYGGISMPFSRADALPFCALPFPLHRAASPGSSPFFDDRLHIPSASQRPPCLGAPGILQGRFPVGLPLVVPRPFAV